MFRTLLRAFLNGLCANNILSLLSLTKITHLNM